MSTQSLQIVLAVNNLVHRDLLTNALREQGHRVAPTSCLKDAREVIRGASKGSTLDLVVLQDDGHCNAFEIARSIDGEEGKTVAMVLVNDHGRADYPDVPTVKNHGNAEYIADKILEAYEELKVDDLLEVYP